MTEPHMTSAEARNIALYVRGVLLAFMEPDDPRLAVIVGRVERSVEHIRASALPSVEQLAQALAEWWSNDGSMPGTGSWEAAGGWSTDAAAILDALRAEAEHE